MSVFTLYSNEIKYKILYLFLSFLICFILSFEYSDAFYYLFIKPFLLVDMNRSFLFTDLREGFQTTFHLAILTAALFTFPYASYLFWIFLKPALYSNEIQYSYTIFWTVWFSICTFLTYNYFLPALWRFFINFEFSSGLVQIYLEATIHAYFTFTLQIWTCVLLFLISPFLLKEYAAYRSVIWFISLLVVSLISPPDFFIQSFVTLSFWLFLEFIFFGNSLRKSYQSNQLVSFHLK